MNPPHLFRSPRANSRGVAERSEIASLRSAKCLDFARHERIS
jgi:hypothetical protein